MNDKAIYDKIRYAKIKEGTWNLNKAHPDKLSSFQKDILVGELLGDFHLYKYKNQIDVGYYLVCSKRDDVVKFISYIQSNMPESMSRKSDKWKDWI